MIGAMAFHQNSKSLISPKCHFVKCPFTMALHEIKNHVGSMTLLWHWIAYTYSTTLYWKLKMISTTPAP